MDFTKRLEAIAARFKSCGASVDEHTNPNMLTAREADQWIDLVTEHSVLLKNITVIRTDVCKGEIPRLDLGTIVSEGANTRSCVKERRVADDYVTWDMVKYRSAFSVSQDFLDCNKLGVNAADRVAEMMRRQVMNDMESASIESDSSLATGDNQSDYNNLMGVNDGFIKQALCCVPECQIIDADGAGPSATLFMQARKKLPPRYRRNRGMYKFLIGPQLFDWWVEARSDRETPVGDSALINGNGAPIWGNDFFEIPLWPENLPLGTTATPTTTVLFTPLDNLYYFVMREFSLERERRIRCDDYQYTMYWKADFAIANPDAVVVIRNIAPCGGPWTGCETNCSTLSTNNPGCVEE